MISNPKLSVLQIKGASMYPFIKDGDYIVIKQCPISQTRNGDVLAVSRQWSENKVCVHRLVWNNNNNGQITLLLKGDNISSFDKMDIGMDNEFLGKVVGIMKDEKLISSESRWLNLIRLLISFCLIPYQIIRRH